MKAPGPLAALAVLALVVLAPGAQAIAVLLEPPTPVAPEGPQLPRLAYVVRLMEGEGVDVQLDPPVPALAYLETMEGHAGPDRTVPPGGATLQPPAEPSWWHGWPHVYRVVLVFAADEAPAEALRVTLTGANESAGVVLSARVPGLPPPAGAQAEVEASRPPPSGGRGLPDASALALGGVGGAVALALRRLRPR